MLIDLLEQLLDVDVDDMDPEIVKSLPFKCHDVTSNNIIVRRLNSISSMMVQRLIFTIAFVHLGPRSHVCSRK